MGIDSPACNNNKSSNGLKMAVVGAGPSGLLLANLLSKKHKNENDTDDESNPPPRITPLRFSLDV